VTYPTKPAPASPKHEIWGLGLMVAWMQAQVGLGRHGAGMGQHPGLSPQGSEATQIWFAGHGIVVLHRIGRI
jgi:hypothetical protein